MIELRGLGEVRKELQKNGGEVVAISTETLEKIKAGRARNPGLPVINVSDENLSALTKLHLVHDNYGDKIAAPGSVLIGAKGKVRWVYYAGLVTDRPDPALVLEQVKKLETAP